MQVTNIFEDRLPLELIVHVFSLICKPTTFHQDIVDYISPFHLGAVCSSWRHLVYSTPKLWTYIVIRPLQYSYLDQLELLESWLDRSGTMPLDIVLRLADEGQTSDAMFTFDGFAYPDTRFGEPFFPLIVKHCARWRSLEVDIVTKAEANYLNLAQGKVPLLKALRIRALSAYDTPVRFTAPAPELVHLSLSSFRGTILISIYPLRHKITSMYLENQSFREVLHLVMLTSASLRHLHLAGIQEITLVPADKNVDFPHLESLVIEDTVFSATIELVQVIKSFPRLTKFAITHCRRGTIPALQSFQRRIKQQDVSIETLIIRTMFDPENDAYNNSETEKRISELLAIISPHSRTLKHLTLEIPKFEGKTERFVKDLHHTLFEDASFFPILQSYKLQPQKALHLSRSSNESTWQCLLPVLSSIQTWYKHRQVNDANNGLGNGLQLKVDLPDFDREETLRILHHEVKQGLEVGFSKLYLPWFNQPIVDWHLD